MEQEVGLGHILGLTVVGGVPVPFLLREVEVVGAGLVHLAAKEDLQMQGEAADYSQSSEGLVVVVDC